jgi:hypothetical protein
VRWTARCLRSYHLMVKSRASLFVFLLVSVFILSGTCHSQTANTDKHSDSLILASGGINSSYRAYPDGRQQLIYTCEVEYPAEDVIAFISRKLRAKNWKPLKEDFMNPGLPSSHVSGWADFEDDTASPSTHVYQWMADWENEGHDIVRYALEYRSPVASTRNLHTLRVIALYIPAPVASEMKRTAAANRASHSPAPVNH